MSKGDDKPERFILHLKSLQGTLEAFCRRTPDDSSLVDDVLQEAVARVPRLRPYLRGTNFRAWKFRYVNLAILETNRKELDRNHPPLDVEPAPVGDEWKVTQFIANRF